MKVVILGAQGMLGSDLGKVFSDLGPYLLDKDDLDVTETKGVMKVFQRLKPNIVINAAAYTDVDGCETHRDLAMKVNGEAPGYLAGASQDIGAVFVHYSTDYVFAGDNTEGYRELDVPENPINFYGESKLIGENAVLEAGGKHYLIRTSWLFGNGGHLVNGRPRNFVETMLRLAQERDEIRVVNDQHGKPTFTFDLAKRTRELIDGKKDFGIYHITNEPATTWYEFAKEIVGQWRKKTYKQNGMMNPMENSRNARIIPCTSQDFPRPAKRPAYSILLNTKLPSSRGWNEALGEYISARP